MQTYHAMNIEFQIRDGAQGVWDRGIIDEVVRSDCYRISGWQPNNPVRVVDVGAHVGSFARWTALRLPRAEVWAFEMMPENFAVLQANAGSLPNVRIQNAALGNRVGSVSTGEFGENTGGTSADWSASGNVEAFDVADLFNEWPHIDCLKMDCEGSEFPILNRIASLPGGVRAHVGCIRAEVHGPRGSAERAEFNRLTSESFPHTDERWLSDGLSLVYAWR